MSYRKIFLAATASLFSLTAFASGSYSASVNIFLGGRSIGTHRRSNSVGERITSPSHMPASHQSATLSRLAGAKAFVREIGPHTVVLIEQHFRRHKKPTETANAAVRLVALANRFSANRVDAACEKAVLLNVANPTKVEEILTSGLENYVPDEDIATEDRAPSGNVRGPEYFSEILDFKRKDRNNG